MSYSLFLCCLFTLLLETVHSFAVLKSKRNVVSTKVFISAATTKVRICSGSSCLGKCRGAFNPLDSLRTLQKGCENVEIEESFCLNQCKRGPNARIIKDDTVLTFEEMNETEIKRKSFQNICNDDRIEFVWKLAMRAADEEVSYQRSCNVHLLSDILPI